MVTAAFGLPKLHHAEHVLPDDPRCRNFLRSQEDLLDIPASQARILHDNVPLGKTTNREIIRFAPPLVITEEQLMECCGIIALSARQFA